MHHKILRLRVFLLILLAASILTSGGSYWLAEQRMKADLHKIHERGFSTNLTTSDRATYGEAFDYWNALPETTKQSFHQDILLRTSSVASNPNALALLDEHEELLTRLKEASKNEQIVWSGERDATTVDQFANFLAGRVIVDSAKRDYVSAVAWLSVLKKFSLDVRSLGGSLGSSTSLLAEISLQNVVFIICRRDPAFGKRMLAEIDDMPDFDQSTILKQDLAASIAFCRSVEWRDDAHHYVGLPEQIPESVAQAATSNRAVRRATEHKLVRAWAQTVDSIGQGDEVELKAMRSMQNQLKADRSFSGRIAAGRWEQTVYFVENLKKYETERQNGLMKIRALLR